MHICRIKKERWPPAASYNAPRCTKQVRLHKRCVRVFVGSRFMQASRAPCFKKHSNRSLLTPKVTHSNIGFQLVQFPGGRKVENRKVKGQREQYGLTLFSNALENDRTLSAAAKREWRGFVGSIMNHHGNKKGGLEQLDQKWWRRYTQLIRLCIHRTSIALLTSVCKSP